jgi:hypothetical protein
MAPRPRMPWKDGRLLDSGGHPAARMQEPAAYAAPTLVTLLAGAQFHDNS